MNKQYFLKALNLVRSKLVKLKVNRAFNSIGSNIFFEFGKNKITVLPNGKHVAQKEWSIWVSDASWRINQNGKYVIGSNDRSQLIQENIQKLLGKRFQSFNVLSHFLDIEFNFEDGYQLTTFFNWKEDNQWTIFLPDQTDIRIDCASRGAIKNIQSLAKLVLIKNAFCEINLLLQDMIIKDIICDKCDLLVLQCKNDITIYLENYVWRLEKNNNYYIGYLDDNMNKPRKLSEIIGNKIKKIEIANVMMDARFQIGDHYVLNTFTCSNTSNQWKICSKNTVLFSANI
jgi:hypothetical protein